MAKPESTAGDLGWVLLFFALFLPCVVAGGIVFGGYLTPAVLGTPNSVPRHGIDSLIEGALLMTGLGLGMAVATAVFAALARAFLSEASHQRWAAQLESGKGRLPPLYLALGRYLVEATRPRRKSRA